MSWPTWPLFKIHFKKTIKNIIKTSHRNFAVKFIHGSVVGCVECKV